MASLARATLRRHALAPSKALRRECAFLLKSPLLSAPPCAQNTCMKRHSPLHTSAIIQHGGVKRPGPGEGIELHFQDHKGTLIKTVRANEADDILAIAHEYDIDLEGACEGSVACSTCHVILPETTYDMLPEPDDDENDMLDMAFALTDTSRLGCQVRVTKEMDGTWIRLPSATRNMAVDGHKPKPH